eukprot:422642-Pelagomonas_calceolata.AAC.1
MEICANSSVSLQNVRAWAVYLPFVNPVWPMLPSQTKAPCKESKIIFKDKNAQPRAGLRALRDPRTNIIETEPARQAHVIENYYTEAMKAVNIKNGKHLPEEAPRNYPWVYKDKAFSQEVRLLVCS